MKRTTTLFAFTIITAIALSGLFKTERTITKVEAAASTAAPVAAPVFDICNPITNVKIRALQRRDFEVTWEYTPPAGCLTPSGFEVVVRAKRKVGGGLLGQKTLRMNAGDRRAVANFASIAGFDSVDVVVKATIDFRPFAQSALDNL